MLKLRSLVKEKADDAVIGIGLAAIVIFLVLFIGGGIMMYFMIELVMKNILFIGIAIVLVITLPILAKAYFTKTTGKMYPEAKKE